jgi:hypothetical protein
MLTSDAKHAGRGAQALRELNLESDHVVEALDGTCSDPVENIHLLTSWAGDIEQVVEVSSLKKIARLVAESVQHHSATLFSRDSRRFQQSGHRRRINVRDAG